MPEAYKSTTSNLWYLFHHVFLPPKLPNGDDRSAEDDTDLLKIVQDCLEDFSYVIGEEHRDVVRGLYKTVDRMRYTRNINGYLDEDRLYEEFEKPTTGTIVEWALEITEQNAGLLIRKSQDRAIFEPFELSPDNASIMTTRGRLIRQFPSVSVSVPADVIEEPGFNQVIANTLATMSYQAVPGMRPQVVKARQCHDEERDTMKPDVVTEFLVGFLFSLGCQTNQQGLCKNTREEVMWNSSRLPWRRSPTWLLVRVTLQLTMNRATGTHGELYKRFMIFFLSRILEFACSHDMTSDVLHVMASKISRRLVKLQNLERGRWIEVADESMKTATSLMEKRWCMISQQSDPDLDLRKFLSFEPGNDVYIHMPKLDEFLAYIKSSVPPLQESYFTPKSQLQFPSSDNLPSINLNIDEQDYWPFQLAIFESWIFEHLDIWLQENIKKASSCYDLKKTILDYHTLALKCYKNSPEGSSQMLLTIVELWIAIDKCAITNLPLLKDYDHEIPTEVFQSLLLCHLHDMERLNRIERYIEHRNAFSHQKSCPSIFRSFNDAQCFSTRYFFGSVKHQTMLRDIEIQAKADRSAKVDELKLLQKTYRKWMELHSQSECQYYEVIDKWGDSQELHSTSCVRCGHEARAKQLMIKVHEWPLPSSIPAKQAVVVELDPPIPLQVWRDATIYLIQDVLGSSCSDELAPRAQYALRSYDGLRDWQVPNIRGRIHLLSEVKPHFGTHRKRRTIESLGESDICLNNGLKFLYFDGEKNGFMSKFETSKAFLKIFQIKLPERSKELEKFISRTYARPNGEEPNEVIAGQHQFPSHIKLNEGKALASIPYGYKLQWMSILREFTSPQIDLNKVETAIIIAQICLQTGPALSGHICRASHIILTDNRFVSQLLEALYKQIARIEENLESGTSLWTLILISTRALSIYETCKPDFLHFLDCVRNVACRWLRKLGEKLNDAQDKAQRSQFQHALLHTSLICLDSFNVDQNQLQDILSSPSTASILIEASIIARDNLSARDDEDSLQSLLLDRWHRIMHRTSPVVITEISNYGNDCLDSAIKRYWPGYVPTLGWHTSSSAEYWLENSSTTVHYNTLTGRLLVHGSPLLYLPADIVAHESHVRLFGRSLINVMPSDIKGMEFSSKRVFQDHTVHFSRQAIPKNSNSLLIRTIKRGKVYDFIPPGIIAGLIPESFINDFVHWYHHDKEEVEFRPIVSPWISSKDNWRLVSEGPKSKLIHENNDNWRLVSEGPKWKLIHDNNDQVVDPSSATAKSICKVFGVLDNVLNQNVVYSPIQNDLSISLPRLRISFLIRNMSDSIESHQFRGMQVDEQQFIGTLVGLESKLTLRSSDGSEDRLVLVPNGQVIFEKKDICTTGPHTCVSIRTDRVSGVESYSIDGILGRLMDKGTLKSKLFLAYLHALTSYCVPDTLTNLTGIEQALSIMNSSSIKSSTCLTKEEGFLLEQIAKLAPGRKFYPTNERVMQEVVWNPQLSFISQHGLFYKISKEIVQNISRIGFLYPHQAVPELEIEHADDELVERDLIKTAQLRVDGFGAELFSTKFDNNYKSRDCTQGSKRAMRTIEMAQRARNVRLSLQEFPQKDLVARIYQLLSDASDFSAKEEEPTLHEMQYNASWLIEPEGTVGNLWYKIHHSFQNRSGWLDPYAVIMWLAAQTFKTENSNQVNQVLFSLAFLPRVTGVRLPVTDTYHLSQGYCFKHKEIRSLVASQVRTLEECPEVRLTKYSYESNRTFFNRRSGEHHKKKNNAISTFVEKLQEQWPDQHPQEPPASSYIDGRAAMSAISGKWRTWHKNFLFAEYLSRIFDALHTYDVQSQSPSFLSIRSQIMPATSHKAFISMDDMFQIDSPSNIPVPDIELEICSRVLPEDSTSHMRLVFILKYLKEEAVSPYEQHYLIELENSLSALKRQSPRYRVSQSKKEVEDALHLYKSTCTHFHDLIFTSLMLDTNMTIPASERPTQRWPNTGIQTVEGQSKFLPRRSPSIFLCQLQIFRWKTLSETWKIKIVAYGIALSLLQRANRLLHQCSDEIDFMKELQNKGHEDWDPLEYPEWLLMECENDFLIRQVQQQTAMTMMAPPNGDNTVMQLNMGEGKSSVLVPSIALALADGSRLVRVIVTKPQFRQMYQSLIARYGNMVSRRIYQFPISREIQLDQDKIQVIQQILQECMEEGGIMLVQPEHLLSFQLMGIECWFNNNDILARELSMLQEYFDVHSRDIIDESDENLSVKYELVYTIGQQRATEHSPQRWLVVLQVLELIQRLAPDIKSKYPQFCEVYEWSSTSQRFPRLGIFHEDALKDFLDRLAKQICHQGLEGFPIARQPETMRIAVQRYISQPELTLIEIESVEKSKFWTEAVIGILLILRGLIAGGVIAHVLSQKRWRVNYGVDVNRVPKTRLAVPFRAKDEPALRSEFSHPDIIIVLTSLSYYYSGLADEDLFELFALLKNDDQATSEYVLWVHYASSLPLAYTELEGINLRDRIQCTTRLFPCLRYSKGAIDYFLSRVVFAKEMREFPHKLSASGWDLGKTKSYPTTGFSGTNDSRYVLPTSVKQFDLPDQAHTSALVLSYIVRPENNVFMMPKCTISEGETSNGTDILRSLVQLKPQVRVILDVGAQIIDLTNQEAAQKWLRMVQPDNDLTQAAIYFDENDILSVVDRFDCIELLQVSPFAKQMDKCLIFLDESHTRGTDLRLPQDYRAAVTLGNNLTKDRLVQACMRMRKLAHGQSVVFCIPEMIANKILQRHHISNTCEITINHVIIWAIYQTHFDAKKSAPLWATQALRFYKQDSYRQERIQHQSDYSREWAERFLEEEAQSLESRYRPSFSNLGISSLLPDIEESLSGRISSHLSQFGLVNIEAASLQEEQERELSPEAEEERQVEKPPYAKALAHHIHPNLRYFVQHGKIDMHRGGFLSAFSSLSNTSAAINANVEELPRDLLVTEDFAQTIKIDWQRNYQSDLFQRPVQWILTAGLEDESKAHLVIISPYEAQGLLEDIKSSATVTLHIYTPRMNETHPSLDNLMLYTIPERKKAKMIPRNLVIQLNLFAGQLYLSSFEEYTQICDTLCLSWNVCESDIALGPDGFIPLGCKVGTHLNDGQYTCSPTNFFQIFLTKTRRNSESVDKTHMGKILNGLLLGEEDFS